MLLRRLALCANPLKVEKILDNFTFDEARHILDDEKKQFSFGMKVGNFSG